MAFLHSGVAALGRSFAIDMTQFWVQGIKVILSLVILTILTALAGGALMTFIGLELLFTQPLEVVLRQVIVNTLTLLAIVEVLKTTLTYFSEGRVKVTFIVDTILVVMLTEVISQWFKEAHPAQWAILGGIIVTLALTRVVAVQWSPAKTEDRSEPQGAI
ncbi:phosphate-starvation-inducible PsiE family protein [Nitrospira sp. M1]